MGLYLAPRLVPQPKIGIVRLTYEIDSFTADLFKEQIAFVRNDPAFKGVVVIINSPGGTASDSEEMFLEMLSLREQMPVVASIDFIAASGAYFTAVGADEIYAKSSAFVGNIGVIGLLPGGVFIEDDILTTGPYKYFGSTRDGEVRSIETLKFAFLNAVQTGRADELNADPEFLSRGEGFDGIRALELGLIDQIASTQDAMDRVAELAGIKGYEAVEIFDLVYDPSDAFFFAYHPSQKIDMERLWAQPTDLAPGYYYRYLKINTVR
ncbi:MAG: S49 family peptidase [Chloroflexi bacterium]|nr:S49 family peptidase [Chloroflexota bacterium]